MKNYVNPIHVAISHKEKRRATKQREKMSNGYANYIQAKEASQILGVTTQTLRNWDNEGKIRSIRAPSGVRRYDLEDVRRIAGISAPSSTKKSIIYCRAPDKEAADFLEQQKAILRSQYPTYELVVDFGSGISWKRKGIQTILEQVLQGTIGEIVVTHRDQLCRYPFELFEFLCNKMAVQLTVLGREEGESESTEIADDLVKLLNVYTRVPRKGNAYQKNPNVSDRGATSNSQEVVGDW